MNPSHWLCSMVGLVNHFVGLVYLFSGIDLPSEYLGLHFALCSLLGKMVMVENIGLGIFEIRC